MFVKGRRVKYWMYRKKERKKERKRERERERITLNELLCVP